MHAEAVPPVFYLDDDPDDLELFADAIEALGMKAALFRHPEELKKALRSAQPAPSILFLDLNMPHQTGLEIMKELRGDENFRQLPIVIYSTASDAETVENCRLSGASLYINKPTSRSALVRALNHAINTDWEKFKSGKNNFLYMT